MSGRPVQASPNLKRHRFKTVAFVLLGFLALYFVYWYGLSSAIRSRLTSIRRAGLPTSCAELDQWYAQPPAGENAADVYLAAFAKYDWWTNKPAQLSASPNSNDKSARHSPPKTKRDLLPIVGLAKLPPRTEALPPEMQQLVAEYLSDNAEALRLLHQAAAMKSCRYPVDLAQGLAAPLGPLNAIRQAERLLALEAILHSERQQPQEAVESLITSFGVSRSLNQEPRLISYLVYVACQGITVANFEYVLNRIQPTDEQLAKLAAAVARSENQQALARALTGERCMGVDILNRLGERKVTLEEIFGPWNEEPSWFYPLFAPYKAAGLLELDEAHYLDLMKQYVEAAQLQPPESMAAARTVHDEVARSSRWHVPSRMLLGSLDSVINKAGRCAAIIRDAQATIAVERYRLANGQLPDQLSDLIPTFLPAVPADPFDAKPLRYKRLAKGYVVYSVGDDREDNGGAETNACGMSYVPGTDITFTVQR